MQITSSDIYWLTRLDMIKNVGIALGFLCVVAGIASLIIYCVRTWSDSVLAPDTGASSMDQNEAEYAKVATTRLAKIANLAFWIFLPLWIAFAFIPTAKEYAAIRVVPVVLNNTVLSETAKEDFGELYALSVTWVKEELKAAGSEAKEAVVGEVKGVITDTVKSVTGTGQEEEK